MPYPKMFHRLVMFGTLYSDIFSTSLSIVPDNAAGAEVAEPDQELLDLLHPLISNWWNDTVTAVGPGIITAAQLTGLKVNRIGTDGKYVDPTTHEHLYPSPVLGAVNSFVPAQLSCVVTLGTIADRGLANKGRMYLPPLGYMLSLSSDGRASIAQAVDVAEAAQRLLNEINAAYETWAGAAVAGLSVGVASDRGAGQFRRVTRVGVGRVVDTVRSRRNALVEDRQELPVTD